MKHLTVAFVAFVLIAWPPVGGAHTETDANAAPTCAAMREAYLAAFEVLHDIRLVSTREYLQLPWIPPIVRMRPGYVPQDPGPYYYRFVRVADKYGWWRYDSAVDWDNRRSADWTVTDGRLSLHVTDMRDMPYARMRGIAIRTDRKVGIDVSAGTSLLFMGWYSGADPLEALTSQSCKVSGEPVDIGGVKTWQVEGESAGSRVRYHLAPSYGFMPVRVELLADEGVLNRRDFDSFEQVADGVYFPMRIIETHFRTPSQEVAFKVEWKVLEIDVNPEIEPDTFDTSLYQIIEGFQVQDAVSGRSYIAGEEVPPS